MFAVCVHVYVSVCGVLLTVLESLYVGAKGHTGVLKLCRQLEHDGL